MGYQKKNKTAQINTPAYVILSPNDNASSLNSIDFSSIGNSISNDSSAFSKIHRLSKISSNNINQDSYQYGSTRQHNYSSLNSFLPSFSTLVDNNSFKKFFEYSLNTSSSDNKVIMNNNFFNKNTDTLNTQNNNMENVILNYSNSDSKYANYFFTKFLLNFNVSTTFNTTLDGKNHHNPLT